MNSFQHSFSNLLVEWYLSHKRDLPWRNTTDPYRIWISEILLQQTRVAQGLPYYKAFLENFPTVFDLAKAPEEKVLKLWQGLGYYSRARNLHWSAKYIVNENNGIFPQTYAEIIQLKGVGDYTASAIASICFGEATAVVDGNVYRVLSRFFGIATPINTSEGIKIFKKLAQQLLSPEQPATHNQALMEFGATHCKPQSPLCSTCPFQQGCIAFQEERQRELPVKIKKTKIRTRYLNYLVFTTDADETIFKQRTGKGIWQKLYEFPLLETKKKCSAKEIESELESELIQKITPFYEKERKHLLSHQKLYINFWKVSCTSLEPFLVSNNGFRTKKTALKKYAVPIPIEKFIAEFLFSD